MLDAATPPPGYSGDPFASEERTDGRPKAVRSYAALTLAADLAAILLASYAGSRDDETLLWTSGALYLTGAPAVHVWRGQEGNAATSVLVRLALPALGALALSAGGRECKRDEICFKEAGGYIGAGLGALLAVYIDAAFIAIEPVEPPDADRPR